MTRGKKAHRSDLTKEALSGGSRLGASPRGADIFPKSDSQATESIVP